MNQEYELKLSNFNRNLQRHEEAIQKYQIENNDLMQDVMHLRELNSRLEANKEELTRHLTSKDIDNEQLQNLLADSKAEIDLYRSQINGERIMVKNLEDMIATNREKEYHNQLTAQERDSEVQVCRDRISLNEQKM
jgi:centrosomal protein CEP135